MTDVEITLLGVVLSFASAGLAWLIAEDEVERQWHERELKRRQRK